jgi:hypothetical protein
MKEHIYQIRVIRRLREEFPDCVIIKNDPDYLQGIPDLLVLYGDRWAMLEIKADKDAPFRPNQEYHVRLFGQMSFAAFIYPENENEVFDDLQHALGYRR